MSLSLHREHELIRRQWRDTVATLAVLDAGDLWHPLTSEQYRGLLLESLDELEHDLAEIERDSFQCLAS